MIAQFLDKMSGRMKARKRSAHETIEAAARRLAAGQSVDEGELEGALVEARLDVGELGRIAELFTARAERLKVFATRATAEKRREQAQARLDAEEKKHSEIVAAFRERVAGIDGELREAAAAVAAGDTARGWLLDIVNVPPSLRDDYQTAMDAEQAARVAMSDAERVARTNRARVADTRRWIDSIEREDGKELQPSVRRAEEYVASKAAREKVQEHERRLKRYAAELADSEAAEKLAAADLAAAVAAVAAVQERILKAA